MYAKWNGTKITLPNPKIEGYTLEGWYSDSTLSIKVGNGGEKYTPMESMTLYAKWVNNKTGEVEKVDTTNKDIIKDESTDKTIENKDTGIYLPYIVIGLLFIGAIYVYRHTIKKSLIHKI